MFGVIGRLTGAAVLVLAAAVAPACSSPSAPPQGSTPITPGARDDGEDRPSAPQENKFDPNAVRLGLRPVASGLEAPLGITHAGDGSNRLFVIQQGGEVLNVNTSTGQMQQFLDLSNLTEAGGEQGLLGLAFHPSFEDNGRFFVNYTNEAGDTVIAEYQATPANAARADPGSARILLEVDQPYSNHNGGQLAFGPDGFLYIGLGDGGSAGDPQNNGQRLNTLLGKILRIDVDADSGGEYAIPRDNPFARDPEALPEIWAFGLRNPWRFSFDQETGSMWIADVGQEVLEEVNRVQADAPGLNYGWDDMEGSQCYEPSSGCERTGKVLPVTEYSHEFGCSITGGFVYRGSEFPSLRGGYIFGDYCSGTIWGVPSDAPTSTRPVELLRTEHSISSFGEDQSGELFLTDLSSGEVLQVINEAEP